MDVSKVIKRKVENEGAKPEARSLLENHYKYFLENAVILRYADYFRLLVIHKNKVLTDRQYKTVKGAKIAFLKFFGHCAWKRYDKPKWTEFLKFEESEAVKVHKISEEK